MISIRYHVAEGRTTVGGVSREVQTSAPLLTTTCKVYVKTGLRADNIMWVRESCTVPQLLNNWFGVQFETHTEKLVTEASPVVNVLNL